MNNIIRYNIYKCVNLQPEWIIFIPQTRFYERLDLFKNISTNIV